MGRHLVLAEAATGSTALGLPALAAVMAAMEAGAEPACLALGLTVPRVTGLDPMA